MPCLRGETGRPALERAAGARSGGLVLGAAAWRCKPALAGASAAAAAVPLLCLCCLCCCCCSGCRTLGCSAGTVPLLEAVAPVPEDPFASLRRLVTSRPSRACSVPNPRSAMAAEGGGGRRWRRGVGWSRSARYRMGGAFWLLAEGIAIPEGRGRPPKRGSSERLAQGATRDQARLSIARGCRRMWEALAFIRAPALDAGFVPAGAASLAATPAASGRFNR